MFCARRKSQPYQLVCPEYQTGQRGFGWTGWGVQAIVLRMNAAKSPLPSRHLFLNRRLVATTTNTETVLAPHRLHPDPLTIDGEEIWCRDHNHVSWYRDDEGVFQGWRGVTVDSYGRLAGKGSVYRIRSDDGLAWETVDGPSRIHTVLMDPADPDPQRRYKGVYHGSAVLDDAGNVEVSWDDYGALIAAAKAGRRVSTGMFSAVSPDGLAWHDHRLIVKEDYAHQDWNPAADLGRNPDTDPKPSETRWWKPGAPGWSGGDNFPCLIRDPVRGKYVAFYRTNIDRRTQFNPGKQRRERGTGRSECETFGDWGEHHLAMRAEPTWQREMGYGAFDYYQLQVWPCADVWLGALTVFHWTPDTVHLELVWSPDTIHWERVAPGQDLVPMDISAGSPSRGGHYACMAPQEIDGEVRMYLGTSDGLHNAESSGNARLWLACFQPDRFAGLAPGHPGSATVVTQPVELSGKLTLNAAAADGRIRVELRDEAGRPVPEYTLDESEPVAGDDRELPVRWKQHGEIARGTYRLRIDFDEAVLYGFEVSQP